MTLIKFKNPAVQTQYDRMPYFSEMMNDFVNGWTSPVFGKSLSPAVNIVENEKDFLITVSAPGLKKEDFKIELENAILTISSEVKKEDENKSNRYTRKEFSISSFKRSFNVPESTDAENIKAVYENGLLEITLPKKEEVKSSPVKITVA
jgi:HSP20 family protein